MSGLPVVHMTLYKHGVGFYRRRGAVEGESLTLTFRREEMDDLLKSLTVIDHGAGQVRGVDYDTPQSQKERLAGCSVILDDKRSLRDLLKALRGRRVQLLVSDGSRLAGLLVGLDEAEQKPQKNSLVSLLQAGSDLVSTIRLDRIEGVELLDETAAKDLRFFLKTALGQETHRSITIRLSPGSHELEVSYIAPAPTWRVSYRLVVEETEGGSAARKEWRALLQGWGIFDNRLEEDLTNISLSLTAGMPISFVYELYTPHTPVRPKVKDEDRVAAGPIMFEAAVPEAVPPPAPAMRSMARAAAPGEAAHYLRDRGVSLDTMAESVASAATGQALGELFQYNVNEPVTVDRGQSAMVPIVSSRLSPRKALIYNGRKMETHPVATIRFENNTGLTLERGPVTVLDGGEYVGEAVLPFTADQAEAVISYAVELGLRVKEEVEASTQLHTLAIKEAYLVQNMYDIRRTRYRLENRTPQAKSVLIEHNLTARYQIFDTPAPDEKSLDTHRYRVEVEAGQAGEFLVQERRMLSQRQELRKLTYRGLQQYFEDKFLDRQTYSQLKDLLDLFVEIGRLEKKISGYEKQRTKIYQTQEQIQKNMSALSQAGEEGRLRGRYVQQLAQSEEELATIDQAIAAARTEIEQQEAQAEQMMARLETA